MLTFNAFVAADKHYFIFSLTIVDLSTTASAWWESQNLTLQPCLSTKIGKLNWTVLPGTLGFSIHTGLHLLKCSVDYFLKVVATNYIKLGKLSMKWFGGICLFDGCVGRVPHNAVTTENQLVEELCWAFIQTARGLPASCTSTGKWSLTANAWKRPMQKVSCRTGLSSLAYDVMLAYTTKNTEEELFFCDVCLKIFNTHQDHYRIMKCGFVCFSPSNKESCGIGVTPETKPV